MERSLTPRRAQSTESVKLKVGYHFQTNKKFKPLSKNLLPLKHIPLAAIFPKSPLTLPGVSTNPYLKPEPISPEREKV
jgi:hypothetical protein